MTTAPDTPEFRIVQFEMPFELHRRFRTQATAEGLSLKAAMIDAARLWLESREGGR
jgi:hypothetical protein